MTKRYKIQRMMSDPIAFHLLKIAFPGSFKHEDGCLYWIVTPKEKEGFRTRDVRYFLIGVAAGGSIG